MAEQNGGKYFAACFTCKTAEWLKDRDFLETWLHGHLGHRYTVLPKEEHRIDEYFREWFVEVMGWPLEAESRGGGSPGKG